MKISTTMLGALVGALGMTPVAAADYDAALERRGIYPGTIHVSVGDRIIFKNESDRTLELRSDNYNPANFDGRYQYGWYWYYSESEVNAHNEMRAAVDNGNCPGGVSDNSMEWNLPNIAPGQIITFFVTDCLKKQIDVTGYSSPYTADISFGSADIGMNY